MIEDWPKTAAIVLNWNGWQDTIECLETVYKTDYPQLQVLVIDNGSTDGSVEKIRAWGAGKLAVTPKSTDTRITTLLSPPVTKSINLEIIETGKNLGFAAGNNVGLRRILADETIRYAWVLNNDVLVTPTALKNMVTRMKEKKGAGICGPMILAYYQPEQIDALGARYDRWHAQGAHQEGGKKYDPAKLDRYRRLETKIHYVVGASMLVSRDFLLKVGLMSEDYFLYFEEIDWATRAKKRFSLALAPEAIVYHKGGESTNKVLAKTKSKTSRFSLTADRYQTQNRIIFTCKFYPYVLPILYLSILGYIIDRLVYREWANAWVVFKAAFIPARLKHWSTPTDTDIPPEYTDF